MTNKMRPCHRRHTFSSSLALVLPLFLFRVFMLQMENNGADEEKDEDDGLLLLLVVELLMFFERQWLSRFLMDTKKGFSYAGWDDGNGWDRLRNPYGIMGMPGFGEMEFWTKSRWNEGDGRYA